MATTECPSCEGRLDLEALLRDGETRCDGCAVTVELAPDAATDMAAAA